MRAIHTQIKGGVWLARMHKELLALLARSIRVGKERVRVLMQRHGIKARAKRKFVVTTDSKHDLLVAPDLMQGHFNPEAPSGLWSGDITYIPADEGWLYLAAVLDLHSRQVMGACCRKCSPAWSRMACWPRGPAKGLIFHSDRGSQYCGHEYQATMKAWGINSSMSRKGNCWDNAPTESF